MASANTTSSTVRSATQDVAFFQSECHGADGEQYRFFVEAGIAAARMGNRLLARMHLETAAHLRRDGVTAWLWLASTAESPAHAISCLEYVLHFDPQHALALAGLNWFRQLDAMAESTVAMIGTSLPASSASATNDSGEPPFLHEAAASCTDVATSDLSEFTEIIEHAEFTEAIDVSALYASVSEIKAPTEDGIESNDSTLFPESGATELAAEHFQDVLLELTTAELLIADAIAVSAEASVDALEQPEVSDEFINSELAAASSCDAANDPDATTNWNPEDIRSLDSTGSWADDDLELFNTLNAQFASECSSTDFDSETVPEITDWDSVATEEIQETPIAETESEFQPSTQSTWEQLADLLGEQAAPSTVLKSDCVLETGVTESTEHAEEPETELLHHVESLVAEATSMANTGEVETCETQSQSSDASSLLEAVWGDTELKRLPVDDVSSTTSSVLENSLEAAADHEAKSTSDSHDRDDQPVEAVTSPTTIVIADDSPTMRKLISGILRPQGYHVVETEDGVAALREIKRHSPAIVLLDINMPKLDGYRVCRLMKSQENLLHIPVVLVSGLASEANVLRGKLVGCAAYLTKPVTPESLLATVQDQLTASLVSG